MKLSNSTAKYALTFLSSVILLYVTPASASNDYWLNAEQSSLHFLSTKNNAVTETHQFGTVSGRIQSVENVAELAISLASVNTGIDIRDERLRSLLFEVGDFPVALVSLPLPPRFIDQLERGQAVQQKVTASLQLHGQQTQINTSLNVVKLQNDSLLITTTTPIILNAAQFKLSKGIAALPSIAKLNSITPTVPVTFSLLFDVDTVSR